jgi:hypothetical protein
VGELERAAREGRAGKSAEARRFLEELGVSEEDARQIGDVDTEIDDVTEQRDREAHERLFGGSQ